MPQGLSESDDGDSVLADEKTDSDDVQIVEVKKKLKKMSDKVSCRLFRSAHGMHPPPNGNDFSGEGCRRGQGEHGLR